jgi:hypothetical protein
VQSPFSRLTQRFRDVIAVSPEVFIQRNLRTLASASSTVFYIAIGALSNLVFFQKCSLVYFATGNVVIVHSVNDPSDARLLFYHYALSVSNFLAPVAVQQFHNKKKGEQRSCTSKSRRIFVDLEDYPAGAHGQVIGVDPRGYFWGS